MTLAGAYDATRTIHMGVKLGVFEALAKGPRDGPSVARRIRANERGTDLLLHALAGLDLLKKTGHRFSLSPLAKKYLLKSSRTSYTTMIEFMEQGYCGYAQLEEAIRSGRSIRPPDMWQNDAQGLEKFIGAMHDLATVRGDALQVAKKLNLRDYSSLLDIGGGPGTFSIALCKAYPRLQAVVYDLPATCAVAKRLLKKNDTTGRVRVEAGDYNRDRMPAGHDVAFLSNIIHSETELDNRRLIKKIYATLNDGGLIVIKDHLLNDSRTQTREGAIFSMTMLLFTRGRSYAGNEVKDWLVTAGFKKVKRIKMSLPMTSDLMVGIK